MLYIDNIIKFAVKTVKNQHFTLIFYTTLTLSCYFLVFIDYRLSADKIFVSVCCGCAGCDLRIRSSLSCFRAS
jgi:hypothetical protein